MLPSSPSLISASAFYDLFALPGSVALRLAAFSWGVLPALAGYVASDFPYHLTFFPVLEQSGTAPYSLWYVFRGVVTQWTSDPLLLTYAGILLIGTAVSIEAVCVSFILIKSGFSRTWAVGVTVLLSLAIAFPLPGFAACVGTLPPNVFHSGTQLLANTAAILAGVALALWFYSPSRDGLLIVGLMGFLSALAKPALTPAWIITVALLMIVNFRRRKVSLVTGFTVAAAVLTGPFSILVWNVLSTLGGDQVGQTGVASGPLQFWSHISMNIPVDALRSWAFPLTATITTALYASSRSANLSLLLPVWLLVFFATLQFALLAETNPDGTPRLYGNFSWGAIAATAALYVIAALVLMHLPWRFRLLPLVILGVQALAGLVYLHNWHVTGSYL